MPFLLKKCKDPYDMLKDSNFYDIVTKMISAKHYMRPNVTEVMNSKIVWKTL